MLSQRQRQFYAGQGSAMSRSIVLLLSGIQGPGGIQRYNRILLRAISEYGQARTVNIRVLSLHDGGSVAPLTPELGGESIRGCGGSKPRFVAGAALTVMAKPDLVINGHVDFSPIVALSALPGLRPKVLTITHGVEVWNTLPFYKRLALRRSQQVWSVSHYTRRQLILQQGVHEGRVSVIQTPLDPDFLTAADAWRNSISPAIPSRLLAITRMNRHDHDKGIDEVIRAMPDLLSAIPDATFTVVGDGDGRSELEGLARGLGLSSTVIRFVGRVSDQELHAYLAGTDAFVLPSRKEGFGLVFLEAMAHGKPVVAGAHGGAPEVVKDGQTGILVRHGERADLVQALARLLATPELRRQMGDAGANLVRERFSYPAFADTVATILDGVLGLRYDVHAPSAAC